MILVTGGAGYIGSHTAYKLVEQGRKIVVLDNLASGHRWAVPEGAEFVEGDIGNTDLVRSCLTKFKIQAVLHFAGSTSVEESVRDPLKYYENNSTASYRLVEACVQKNIRQFIFSSSAAIYGETTQSPVLETAAAYPKNPYGKSKLITEWMLSDLSSAHPDKFASVSLRYFNVAGAAVEKGIGQATPLATQLIKVACEVAVAKRPYLKVFGTDYPTVDGTCVRDYIHVEDLADAHLLALEYLEKGGSSDIFNCGYGVGYSVKQVVDAVKAASGINFEVRAEPRRPGDAAAIYADAGKMRRILRWSPKFENLSEICRSSYQWELHLKNFH